MDLAFTTEEQQFREDIRAWVRDESPDMGSTMAALDSALDRAERIARPLGLLRGGAEPAPEAEIS